MSYHFIRRGLTATALVGGIAGAAIAGTGAGASATTATPSAATVSPPSVGTLSTLPYTYPAGSGGELVNPLGISAHYGKVYVSNSADSVVSMLAGGKTTTVAGSLEGTGETGDGGPATAATLNQPAGTAEDASGNIYIADTNDNVVRKIDVKTGIITRVAGTGVAGDTKPSGPAVHVKLDAPQGVAVNAAGDVLVADTVNNRVLEVLPSGRLRDFAGTGRAGYKGNGHSAVRAQLDEPTAVAVDSRGNVYIADAGNNVIRRVDARTGIITTVAGDYAADQAHGGLGGYSGDGGPATSARLHTPDGVALDHAGDLFIADTFNNAIREVTPHGTIFTVVNATGANGMAPSAGGETPGSAPASKLNGPSAVAVDNSNATLYIADTSNNEVAAVTGLVKTRPAPGPVAPK